MNRGKQSQKKSKQPNAVKVSAVRKKADQKAALPSTPVPVLQRRSADTGVGVNAKLMAQERANFALQAVQAAIAKPSIESKEFKSQVRRLPGMIQVNGFGQAIAFYYAKGKSHKLPACGEVYALLECWLCDRSPHSPYRAFANATEPRLMSAITGSDQQAYRHAQAETQALLQWVKRFCEGLIVQDTDTASEEA